MRIGCLVWNQFQVGHFAEIIKHFDEPDVIFTDRDTKGLGGFNANWLTDYGAYSRFIPEIELGLLDGQYDAVLTQFTPPLARPWQQTQLIMTQYSMAKPKTAYNARWRASDLALVYGDYSDAIIRNSCPTAQMGNPRFDPFLENRLDPHVLGALKAALDPAKKTLAFLPTWGDLNSQAKFKAALATLLPYYNVLHKPHHMTPLKDGTEANTLGAGAINVGNVINVLDVGPYIMAVSDLVVSDMSGIIFDALYCSKPVALLGLDHNFADHKKADPMALEVASANRIGPVVTDPAELLGHIDSLVSHHPYSDANEALVVEAFAQRGGCGVLAAESIRSFIEGGRPRRRNQDPATSSDKELLLAKAFLAALKRMDSPTKSPKSSDDSHPRADGLKQAGESIQSLFTGAFSKLPSPVLAFVAKIAGMVNAHHAEGFLYCKAAKGRHSNSVSKWVAKHRNYRLISKARMTPYTHRKILNQLRDRGDFFLLGREVEDWSSLEPCVAYRGLYDFYRATEIVRFSRAQFRKLHAGLTEYARSPSTPDLTRKTILRDVSLLTETVDVGDRRIDQLNEDLLTTTMALADMAAPLEWAVRNEILTPDDRMAMTPNGDWLPVSKIGTPIFEIGILLHLVRPPAGDNEEARDAMLYITRAMIDALRKDGWAILPRVQPDFCGAPVLSGRYPSAAWCTTSAELGTKVHLDVGSFSGNITIDDRDVADLGLKLKAAIEQK